MNTSERLAAIEQGCEKLGWNFNIDYEMGGNKFEIEGRGAEWQLSGGIDVDADLNIAERLLSLHEPGVTVKVTYRDCNMMQTGRRLEWDGFPVTGTYKLVPLGGGE